MKRIVIIIICLILFAGLLTYTILDQRKTQEAKQAEAPSDTYLSMETEKENENIEEIRAGETVAFGHYEQDDDPTIEESLLWYVIEKKDGKVLLLSHNVIEVMIFSGYSDHSDDGKQSRWKYSIPREWLNGEFYDKAFNEEEKGRIRLSLLKTDSYDMEKNAIIDTTEDHVFLLNAAEVESLNEDVRKANASQHAINQGVYISGGARYWTRSIAENEYVGYYTNGDKVSFYVPGYEKTGIRPAMWISIP